MTKQDIQVKVFKRTKKASYPEHIMVKKNSTGEMAHLFFNEGNLRKMIYSTHIASENRDRVAMAYQIEAGQFQTTPPFSESDLPQSAFFVRTLSRVDDKKAILFFDDDLKVAVSIYTDFNGKCLPDEKYIRNQLALVEEEYFEQKKPTCSQLIQNANEHD